MMNNFKGIIFDMDGVIFDSERLYLECCMEAAAIFGIDDMENTCMSCIGLNTEKTLARFSEVYGKDFPVNDFWKEATSRFAQKVQNNLLPVKKGAREILEYLKNNNVPIALASSTITGRVRSELAAAGLINYFDVIVGGDMVTKSKPEPDIFLYAADKLKIPAKNCCIIEDSFNGVRAAHASGAFVIMVPDLIQPTEEIALLADIILPSLTDVGKYLE